MGNRQSLIPTHIKDKKKRRIRRRIVGIVFLTFLLIVGLGMATRLPFLLIQSIEVKGNELIDSDLLEAKAQTVLDENYAFVIPKRNTFFVPTLRIKNDLMLAYPRIEELDIKIRGHVLEINIQEREGKYLWCGGALSDSLELGSTCYYADNKGYLFSEAPYFSPGVYFTFYGGSMDALLDPIGSTFLNAEDLMTLLTLRSTLDVLGLQVEFANVTSETMFELYLRPVSDTQSVRTKVIARFDDDPKTLIKNLKAALANPGFQSEYTDKKANLLYFDLRFPNKVYYKFSE